MIALAAHWKLRDGGPDELSQAPESLYEKIEQNEPGTLLFSVGTPGAWPPVGPRNFEMVDFAPQNPPVNELVFIEVYADAETLAAHLQGRFRAFLDRHHFETPWQGHPRPTMTRINPPETMMKFLDGGGLGGGVTINFGRGCPHSCETAANAVHYHDVLISPAIDELVVDFAIQLLDRERLGEDDVTDYLAFAGAAVPKQRISREVATVDIAATLAVWLRMRHPSGLVGKPLLEVLSQ